MNMPQIIREEARLTILKTLAEQDHETLNSNHLKQWLETYGINQERAWVHEELKYLRDMDAVTLLEAGSVLVATLTEKGARHLSRAIAIEGVKRPSRPGG